MALVAALASLQAPEDLGLIVIARPHTLPDAVADLPHGLVDVVDPDVPGATQQTLEGVMVEIERRRQSGSADDADMVLVGRNLRSGPRGHGAVQCDRRAGPQYGVRVATATERPVTELFGACPFVDRLGTHLVLQTADEEDSVALVGTTGAERLGAGGHAPLRLEGRMPHPRLGASGCGRSPCATATHDGYPRA